MSATPSSPATGEGGPISPSTRLLPASGSSRTPTRRGQDLATRDIIHSSIKGWNPLQINKRGESPARAAPEGSSPRTTQAGARRTSSSFKHVKNNSLVSNSVFKSPPAPSEDPAHLQSSKRLSFVDRPGATGSGSPIKHQHQAQPPALVRTSSSGSIGLGITAKHGRSSSGGGSSAARKVSPVIKSRSPSGTRRVSNGTERKISGGALSALQHSPENAQRAGAGAGTDSPDVKSSASRKPRQSMGLKTLSRGALVSGSPFLQGEERRSPDKLGSPIRMGSPRGGAAEHGSPSQDASPRFTGSPARFSSPPVLPAKEDVFTSPAPAFGGASRAAPSLASPYRQSPLSVSALRTERRSPSPAPELNDRAASPLAGDLSPATSTPTRSLAPPAARLNATPTPTKSSITQRRLRGPRFSGGLDSPSDRKAKTVTFQDGPVEVKEFDRDSVDGGSEDRYGSDWEDASEEEADTMDSGRHHSHFREDGSGGGLVIMDEGEDESGEYTEHEQHVADESMTANFIDSLVEDGYFSPPEMNTPQFADEERQPSIAAQLLAPQLSTPSLGGSIDISPAPDAGQFPLPPTRQHDVDEYGVPYGRTHHAERAATAHLEGARGDVPLEQPDLPRLGAAAGLPLLRTANAAAPAVHTRPVDEVSRSEAPHAHQAGSFEDPFMTIQTATSVYLHDTNDSAVQRDEGGVPLGRTSHSDRAKVARLMATQQLGLGMPRRPTLPSAPQDDESEDGSLVLSDDDDADYSSTQIDPVASQDDRWKRVAQANADTALVMAGDRQSSNGSEVSVEKRSSYLATSVMSPSSGTSKRSLPQPPKPQPLDLPEPVDVSNNIQQQKAISALDVPFTLPDIGKTSPLFDTHAFEASADEPTNAAHKARATTPTRAAPITSPLSPSRIPVFDFEESNGHSFGDLSAELTASQALKMVKEALPAVGQPVRAGLPQSARSEPRSESASVPAWDAPTTRVRQRISKDMIRQKLEQQRVRAEQPPASLPADVSTVTFVEKALLDKALPPPPGESASAERSDAIMTASVPSRPPMRNRESTPSAQDVLQKAGTEGSLHSPKSALDRLVSDFAGTTLTPTKTKASLNSPVAARQLSEDSISTPSRTNSVKPNQELAHRDSSGSLAKPTLTAGEKSAAADKKRSQAALGVHRRRSQSTGDARPETLAAKRSSTLDPGLAPLGEIEVLGPDGSMLLAIEDEMKHIASDRPYRVREQRQKIVARSDDKVKHNGAGDVDEGKAWRQLRRPSDINQYAKEMRAMKAKDVNSDKSFGTIFVKVLHLESLAVPMPDQDTSFCITLDNGIDYIRTPYSTLKEGAKVNQEFALVEHANFEFALGLEIRRDPHIIKMLHDNMQSTPTAAAETASMSSSVRGAGFKNLFQSPRKRESKAPLRPQVSHATLAPQAKEDNICRYFSNGDSTIARTHIVFSPIAKQCDAQLLEIRYPMFGLKRSDAMQSILRKPAVEGLPPAPSGKAEKKLLAKVTLQVFRLPPLPGLKPDQLPNSIDECLRGMRHHTWHEQEYLEGVLTQRGGDCAVPRRRSFKLHGSNLIASNAVTRKEVFSIDLRQLKAAEDNNTPHRTAQEEDEGNSPMPRSFRLLFKDGDSIAFAADNDEDKTKWLSAFASLIERGIPSNPLWAEMLAARQRETRGKKRGSGTSSKHGLADQSAADA